MKIHLFSAAVLAIATSAAYGQSQPVQWRVEDGGNGHWYGVELLSTAITWEEAAGDAVARGGHLPTVSNAAENDIIVQLFLSVRGAGEWGPFLGALKDGTIGDSKCLGWRWITNEPFAFVPDFPNGDDGGYGPCGNSVCDCVNELAPDESRLHLWRQTYPVWNSCYTDLRSNVLIVEWSADCNNDGIVDYGQILSGQLVDANSNGVPDTCEAPPCPADVNGNGQVNGVDLAAVLGAWGTNGQSEGDADINDDGIVNGQDLAFVLGSWGPCSTVPAWATVIEFLPDPAVVTNPTLRAAITATRLPWRVRDTATQIELVLIPPGTFQMGCSPSLQYGCNTDESPVHQVTLTQPFYMGRYEVTQAQWTARMGSNPSAFQSPSDQVPTNEVSNRPVERVSWTAVQAYLGLTGMRLPSEAEWEWAYRAGTTTAFHAMADYPIGTNEDQLVGYIAWLTGNSVGQTRPVGRKAGNGFGLHDMSGNVWEWLHDWYGPYSATQQVNPTGPESGSERVIRGGSWNLVTYYLRSSHRFYFAPNNSDAYGELGFRVARNP